VTLSGSAGVPRAFAIALPGEALGEPTLVCEGAGEELAVEVGGVGPGPISLRIGERRVDFV
jgi:hypothetical protein